MKLILKSGTAESTYTLKELEREGRRAARESGRKFESLDVVLTGTGIARLLVRAIERTGERAGEHVTLWVAL
jgi:hypothetical protein